MNAPALQMSEAEWQDACHLDRRLYHWRIAHFRPAKTEKGWRTPMTGDVGFPDLVIARWGTTSWPSSSATTPSPHRASVTGWSPWARTAACGRRRTGPRCCASCGTDRWQRDACRDPRHAIGRYSVIHVPPKMTKILQRVPAPLLASIDERAAKHGLSRAAWIRLALERVVDMPSQVTKGRDQRF